MRRFFSAKNRAFLFLGCAATACAVLVVAGRGDGDGTRTPSAQDQKAAVLDKLARGYQSPDGDFLTPEDLAAQDERDAAFFKRRSAFIKEFASKDFDPAELPRDEVMGSPIVPPTLERAATESDAIVQGSVESIHFAPDRTTANIRVNTVATGRLGPDDLIQVGLGFTLDPNQDFSGAVLGVMPGAPVLLEGDEAVFLLTKYENAWWGGGPASAFQVVDGRVHAPDSQPFHGKVDGLTAEALLARLRDFASDADP